MLLRQWRWALLVAAAQMSACTTLPPTRFYSLLPAPALAATAAQALAPTLSWELLPVTVPVQVDQPQLVVRMTDDSLAVLEHDRWIAPLADEIRSALAQHIGRGLAQTTSPAGIRWQLSVEVLRLDSMLGRHARLEVQWLLQPVQAAPTGPVLRCHAVYQQAVAGGVPALLQGHRMAVAQLGNALVAALHASAVGATPRCDGAPAP